MKKIFFSLVFILLFLIAGTTSAYVASSPNYQLEKDSLNFGGNETSASANYSSNGTLGEIISGISNGTNYNASSGYRYMNLDPLNTTRVGCMDNKATNYDSLATIDTTPTSCTYIHIPGGVLGCLDPKANNYNSNATVSDNSCTYSPIIVVLGCTNPQATNYDPKATKNDGSCTYPPGEENDILGCLDSKATNYNPKATKNDGRCEYNPFTSLSTTTIEVITKPSKDWDFKFIQPKENIKTFDNRMRVRVIGEKNLTILFNSNLAPDVLKTIGVTLTDPADKTKTFSFLMHRNVEGTAYEATVGPLIRNGTYPVDIYLINYSNQAIQHIKGNLIVSGVGVLSAAMIEETAVPVAVTTGLAVGFLPTLYNLLTVLLRAFGYFFGRRKKDNPWGTVYDSVTKRPLDPVYLTVKQNDKDITTAITDIDGRFSFFLPDGTYMITAGKTHYRFPSERLAGKTADELYEHLYFGKEFTATGEAVINLNIPMDPLDFDWNEFAKTKTNFFEFYNKRNLWLNRLYKFFFGLGLASSVFAFIFLPSWWNVIILVLYIGLIIANRLWQGQNKPIKVTKAGEPLPFAIIRVFLPDLNQQIKYTVADKMGRFHLLVRPGVYYYTVEEKQLDGTYLKVFQSQPVSLPKGILTTDISVK